MPKYQKKTTEKQQNEQKKGEQQPKNRPTYPKPKLERLRRAIDRAPSLYHRQ